MLCGIYFYTLNMNTTFYSGKLLKYHHSITARWGVGLVQGYQNFEILIPITSEK